MPVRGQGEAMLRVEAVSICGSDIHAVAGRMPLFSFPRIIGHEIAATVLEVDAGNAQGLQVGDLIVVMPGIFCGTCIACRKGKTNCCKTLRLYGVQVDGGLQRYISIPAEKLVKPPKGAKREEAALVEPLSIGAHVLSRISVDAGDRALVLGAGPIGVCCALMAQVRGAKPVLADVSAVRAAQVMDRFGFEVLNPQDFGYSDRIEYLTDGDLFHIVIDTTANKMSMESAYRLLGQGGQMVLVGVLNDDLTINEASFHMKEPLLAATRNSTVGDFAEVLALWEEGRICPSDLMTATTTFDKAANDILAWTSAKDAIFKGVVLF